MPKVLAVRTREGDYVELDRFRVKAQDGSEVEVVLSECVTAALLDIPRDTPTPITIMGAGDIASQERIGGLG